MSTVSLSSLDWSERLFGCAVLVAILSINVFPKLFAVAMVICLLISLTSLRSGWRHLNRYDYFFIICLVCYPLLSAISLLSQHVNEFREFDTITRFVMCIPIYLFVRSKNIHPVWFLCGATIASVFFGMTALYETFVLKLGRANGHINAITFGQMSVLLSFYSLCLIQYIPTTFKPINQFLIKTAIGIAACFGVVACVLSGSRGPLLALPALAFVFLWTSPSRRTKRIAALGISAFFITLAISAYLQPQVFRLDQALNDIHALEKGKTDTSIGVRTELWKASWHIFEQHPLNGVGKGQLSNEMQKQQGTLAIDSSILGYHAHNDYLQLLAEQGIVGLLSILILYLGSLIMALKNSYYNKRLLLGVCICWLVFGLTQVQLAHEAITLLEIFTLAFFAAYSQRVKLEKVPNQTSASLNK